MSCCAGCLPASVRDIAPAAPGAVVRIAFAPFSQAFDGLSPAPNTALPDPSPEAFRAAAARIILPLLQKGRSR
jgi:hypothetical protein